MTITWYVYCFDINELKFIAKLNSNKIIEMNFGRSYPIFITYDTKNNKIDTNVKPTSIEQINCVNDKYVHLPIGERIGCFMNHEGKIIMLDISQFDKVKHANINNNQAVIRQPKNTYGNYFSIEV